MGASLTMRKKESLHSSPIWQQVTSTQYYWPLFLMTKLSSFTKEGIDLTLILEQHFMETLAMP